MPTLGAASRRVSRIRARHRGLGAERAVMVGGTQRARPPGLAVEAQVARAIRAHGASCLRARVASALDAYIASWAPV
eukprot:1614851-Rhodomonas_salina.1